MNIEINLPVSPDTIWWAAERVVDMHVEHPGVDRATGRCAQCQPDACCNLLDWARSTLTHGPDSPSLLLNRRTA